MTTEAYRPLTVFETIFKDLVWDPGIKAGELALEGAVPAFNAPILKQLEEGTIDAVSDYLFAQFVLFVDVTAIKLVNAAHQSAYEAASISLMVLAHDKGIDSDEFKKAREDAKADLSRFTQLGR